MFFFFHNCLQVRRTFGPWPDKAHEYFQVKGLEVNRITHLFESSNEQGRQARFVGKGNVIYEENWYHWKKMDKLSWTEVLSASPVKSVCFWCGSITWFTPSVGLKHLRASFLPFWGTWLRCLFPQPPQWDLIWSDLLSRPTYLFFSRTPEAPPELCAYNSGGFRIPDMSCNVTQLHPRSWLSTSKIQQT